MAKVTAGEYADRALTRAETAFQRAQAARFAAWDAWWAALDIERRAAELVAVAERDVREARAAADPEATEARTP